MGLTEKKIQQIEDRNPDVFSHKELLALSWSDLILANGTMGNKQELVEEMKQVFTHKELVELSVFIALVVGFIPLVHVLEL
jgi:hypothetical protein